MRNFDDHRKSKKKTRDERTFILGGETFVRRSSIRPEALLPFDSIEEPTHDFTTCKCQHRLNSHPNKELGQPCEAVGCNCKKFTAKILTPGSPLAVTLEKVDETFLAMVESGDNAKERYERLRSEENEDDAIEVEDLMEVIEWMMASDTGRPTGSPSVSTDGREQPGTPLTDDSSLSDTVAA